MKVLTISKESVSNQEFLEILLKTSKFDNLNKEQQSCICADEKFTQIIAGPGSGKTTVLLLRVIKFLIVDTINPKSIMLTTFTKKAATELRTKFYSYIATLSNFVSKTPEDSKYNHTILKINKILKQTSYYEVIIGTLDSICYSWLREHDTVQRTILGDIGKRILISQLDSVKKLLLYKLDDELKEFLQKYGFLKYNQDIYQAIISAVETLSDRIFQNMVDLDRFQSDHKNTPIEKIIRCVNDYLWTLNDSKWLDYTIVEHHVYNLLQSKSLPRKVKIPSVILVDEYQDTNPLQEAIYFNIIKSAASIENIPYSLSIVGDDDQSIYRFRGGVVEIFKNFVDNIKNEFPNIMHDQIKRFYLNKNYRSTKPIIKFINNYINYDSKYLNSRISEKKDISFSLNTNVTIPVLLLLGKNIEEISQKITKLLRILDGKRHVIVKTCKDERYKISTSKKGFLPITLLKNSPKEIRSNKKRLPWYIRKKFEKTYNPRGRDFSDCFYFNSFLGTILNLLDPKRKVETFISKREASKKIFLSESSIKRKFTLLRNASKTYFENNSDEKINRLKHLSELSEKDSIKLEELIDTLILLFPKFLQDKELQEYLFLLKDHFSNVKVFSSTEFKFSLSDKKKQFQVLLEIYEYIFMPIIFGLIKFEDEEQIISNLGEFKILSIHQSKGLEFPIVFVDIGSDFKSNRGYKSLSYRFPTKPQPEQLLEELLFPYSNRNLKYLLNRSSWNRTVDDLIRKYFVAFSRAKKLLICTGRDNLFSKDPVKTIMTGWKRNKQLNDAKFESIFDPMNEITEISSLNKNNWDEEIILNETSRRKEIPIYSITKDIIPYDKCPLQYRLNEILFSTKNDLSSSIMQGIYLHKLFELYAKEYQKYQDIDLNSLMLKIEFEMKENNKGISIKNSTKKLANKFITTYKDDFFRNIKHTELQIDQIRKFSFNENDTKQYIIRGVIDSLVKSPGFILKHIDEIEMENAQIIVDYKVMNRPRKNSPLVKYLKWQMAVYKWLYTNSQNEFCKNTNPIGVIIFLKELYPSKMDMKELALQVKTGLTDIIPNSDSDDYEKIINWTEQKKVPDLSASYRWKRAMWIYNLNETDHIEILAKIDTLVKEIEDKKLQEEKTKNILRIWQPYGKKRICDFCSIKKLCKVYKHS